MKENKKEDSKEEKKEEVKEDKKEESKNDLDKELENKKEQQIKIDEEIKKAQEEQKEKEEKIRRGEKKKTSWLISASNLNLGESGEESDTFFNSCDYYEVKSEIRSEFFEKYYSKGRILLFILRSILRFFIHHFEYICYLFMIIQNIYYYELYYTLFWPLLVFIAGIVQYPRPGKYFWVVCILYCSIVLIIKLILNLNFISDVQSDIEDANEGLNDYAISMKSFKWDAVLFTVLILNQSILIQQGLWEHKETSYETIYDAHIRIKKYNSENYNSKYKQERKSYNKRELTNKEILDIIGPVILGEGANMTNEIQAFYKKNFNFVRNEKPGKDFYKSYTIIQMLILVYTIIFYTEMEKDISILGETGGASLNIKQFSGNMVIFALLHIIVIVLDRVIYLKNARKVKEITYKVFDNKTGEDITSQYPKYEDAKKLCEEKEQLYEKVNFIHEGTQLGLILKFGLQVVSVIGIHLFIFLYLPQVGKRNSQEQDKNEVYNNPFIIIFYIMYMLYFFLSALQVKYGLCDLRKNSSLMAGSNLIYSVFFKVVKAIPFLFEVKSFMDWTFTTTSLDIFQWIKYEEIFSMLFVTKCYVKTYLGIRIGSAVGRIDKIFMGGAPFIGMLLLIFAPLILFSNLNPSNQANSIKSGTLSADLEFINGGLKPYASLKLYEATSESVSDITEDQYKTVLEGSEKYRNNYPITHVQIIRFHEFGSTYDFPLKHVDILNKYLNTKWEQVNLVLKYSFEASHRAGVDSSTEVPDMIGTQTIRINETTLEKLKEGIFGNDTKSETLNSTSIIFELAYPNRLKVPSDSKAQEMNFENKLTKYSNFSLNFTATKKYNAYTTYFSLYTIWNDTFLSNLNIDESFVFITFSDYFSQVTFGYNVLTFYVGFIVVIGQVLRSALLGEAERCIYSEMVNTNKLMNVCEGIRISRIRKDLLQESRLYFLLIDLMRSPEIIKRMTKSSLVFVEKGNIVEESNIREYMDYTYSPLLPEGKKEEEGEEIKDEEIKEEIKDEEIK
ncbi:MAG: hypothetical protein MJ252_20530, partial [archaeon]|nr:hypothetical protein [archaeon]